MADTAGTRVSPTAFASLPVLDVALLRGNPEQEAEFVQQLRHACHNAGFLYIKNHGISQDLCDRVFALTRRFFELPLDRKRTIEKIHSPHFRGYTCLGDETTAGRKDLREQIDFGLEAPALALGSSDPAYLRLQGPNLWPAEDDCPGFRATIIDFMVAMHRLSCLLMEAVALSLGLPREHFHATFSDLPHARLKVVQYPPPSAAEVDAGLLGVGPHKDYGYLAILFQDDVGGLQVLNGAGEWIDATPIPGTAVVNLGEMLERASWNYYIATVHRVRTVPTAQPRISIPYFANPRLDTRLEPLPIPAELIEAAVARSHAGANARNEKLNPIYPVYGETAYRGLARSHPDVAAKYYPDVALPPSGPTYV